MRRDVKNVFIAKFSCHFKILILPLGFKVIPYNPIKGYSLISSEQDHYISCNQSLGGFNYAP